MPKMVGIREAAEATGLSLWELGRGARAGDYPHIKIGIGRGKYLFSIDQLEKTLEEKALANMTTGLAGLAASYGGIRPVVQ